MGLPDLTGGITKGIQSIGEGLTEFAFGRDPKVDITERGTLSPEQEEALKKLLAGGVTTPNQVTSSPVNVTGIQAPTLGSTPTATAGTATAPTAATAGKASRATIDESGLSLDAVEKLRSELATGQAAQLFGNVAARAADPSARKEHFETQVQPLEEQAQGALKTVGRQFGEGGFFSSDRAQQDQAIFDAFAKAESQLLSELIREDEGRALEAATGLGTLKSTEAGLLSNQLGIEAGLTTAQLQSDTQTNTAQLGADTQISLGNLQSGTQVSLANLDANTKTELANLGVKSDADLAVLQAQVQTQVANLNAQLEAAIASGNNELAAQVQNQLAQMQSQQLFQQLLGVQTKENIVLNQAGTQGQIGSTIGAGIGTFAALSDRRLKYDIKEHFMLPIGVPFVSWRWRSNGKPGYGVIAQDLLRVFPAAVGIFRGWLFVNYDMIFKQASNFWTTGR